MKVKIVNGEFGITGLGARPVGTVVELDAGYVTHVLIPLGVVEPVVEAPAPETKAAAPAARRTKATKSVKETR